MNASYLCIANVHVQVYTCIYMYMYNERKEERSKQGQRTVPAELPTQLSWLGPNLTFHSAPAEQASYMLATCIYVRDRCKIRTVLKPSDGFEAGQTAAKRARRLRSRPDGFTTFH